MSYIEKDPFIVFEWVMALTIALIIASCSRT